MCDRLLREGHNVLALDNFITGASKNIAHLNGGGQFQFPASIDVMDDPELRELFTTFWAAGAQPAVERMKLFKLAWDIVGSDHANRAASYEKFFVGPAFAVRNYNFINAPWDELHGIAEDFMTTYGYRPGADDAKAPRAQADATH